MDFHFDNPLIHNLSVDMDKTSIRVGALQIIFGPMFSGKTTELLRRIRRYNFARLHTVVIKYKNDTRYDADCAATHDK